MSQTDFYTITYRLHGELKTFMIRSTLMNNAEAWQWASCDAGLAPIPKPGRPPLKRFSKPLAERFGVTEVQWRKSPAVCWDEDAVT
ncbi:DUF6555 family protein [Pseudomonas atacamensis]|jgi:hypothetical protein|uniref:Uncharacterized protein n=1 Tax=Pseudomonas atacamensis TaxID=2565368 RepID=A0AAQ2D8Y0_9PSED|nr:DUF6555 family protein [Pseudomonas atacamensis]MDT6918343.1 hypothetical protein [Pseudomonas atacamensis]THF28552.1 hypothetical protein E5170_23050 [Pseudomonas atacamensis]